MTEDKNLIKNLEYLDSILEYFIISEREYTTNIISLSNDIFKLNLTARNNESPDIPTEENFFESVFSPDNDNALFYKVKASIKFLIGEGYLIIEDNQILKITYKGIIKYSEGFVNEHQKQSDERNRLLNVENFQNKISRRMLVTNIVIAIGTTVAAIYYFLEFFSTPVYFCK
jgi:hypothetical protein